MPLWVESFTLLKRHAFELVQPNLEGVDRRLSRRLLSGQLEPVPWLWATLHAGLQLGEVVVEASEVRGQS